jgi:hypothetical protein
MSELRHHNRTPLRRGFVLSHTPFLRPDARRPAACGCSLARSPLGTPCTRRKWLNNNNLRAGCRGATPPTSPAPRCLLPSSYRPWQAPAPRRPIGRAPACARRLTPPCSADRAKSGPLRCSNFQPIGQRAQRLASGGNSAPTTRAQNIQLPLTGNRYELRKSMSNRRECGGVRGT